MKSIVIFVILVLYYARSSSGHCPKNKTYKFHRKEPVKTCYVSTVIVKTPGCICKKKFVMHEETNRCILPKDCPEENQRKPLIPFPLPLPKPGKRPNPGSRPYLPILNPEDNLPFPIPNPVPKPKLPLPKPGKRPNPGSRPYLPIPEPGDYLPNPIPNLLPKPNLPILAPYLPVHHILPKPGDLLNPITKSYKPGRLPVPLLKPIAKPPIPKPERYLNPLSSKPDDLPVSRYIAKIPLNRLPYDIGIRSGEPDPVPNLKRPISCLMNKTYQYEDIHIHTCDHKEIRPEEPGCYCEPGYVLDVKTNLCVLPKDCPNKMGPGYAWLRKECVPGSACAILPDCPANKTYREMDIHLETCDNVALFPRKPGCYCKDGYVYNRFTGHCILKKDCPKEIICGRNEEFDKCATPCPKSCNNINPFPCYAYVCRPSCVCVDPYIRDQSSGKCILPLGCPEPKCGRENEEFSTCTSSCEPTCSQRTQSCTLGCRVGCFCTEGYIRDKKDGTCILIEKCPTPELNEELTLK